MLAIDGGADARRAAYRGSDRREIARLRREGYRVHGDDGAIDAFHSVYTSAMLRLGAGSRDAFGPEQLRAMIDQGGMRSFVVRKDEDVAAAWLFTLTDTGSHDFLSGTDPRRHRKRGHPVRTTGAGKRTCCAKVVSVLRRDDVRGSASMLRRAVFDSSWRASASAASLRLARGRFNRTRLDRQALGVVERAVEGQKADELASIV